ncbi:recombinase family protein [Lyngbya sp. PCC 8106]|uniref:recombinase family protein n=1 Tax=Lyngbya sp. (strain PCC 8106) TaxID=313612 RepID=UPI0000EA8CD1|nr:recombinase family protein [Lyngbya sp. PCC 8106]EAW36286.1 site-specific recombinase, resolvase family protein [Lyngbya sp. PCC 8106]
MVTYAYLRVSTDHQDLNNQRHGIFEYANIRNLGSLKFVEDATSGRIKWQSRAVGQLLTQTAKAGDVVIFAEISRMARSTLQVLEMLECCMQRGISVHIAKQQMVLDGSMSSRITATVLGLAAEIERELISLRTTEALAKCKAEGQKLGRPKGQKAVHLKLDEKEAEIRGYLAKGISKRAIAKLVECSPSTLYQWMERRHIHPRKKSRV